MALIANNISGSASNSSRIGITGSVIFANNPGSSFPSLPNPTVTFFVSGSNTSTGADQPSILFKGDHFVSGAFGVSDYIQMKPVGSLRIPTNQSAGYMYVSGSTNDIYFTQYAPGTSYTNTTRLRWLESMLTTGLLHGGVLSTQNGTTTFSITSGSGIVVSYNASTTTDPYPTVNLVEWPAYVSSSLTYVTSSLITYIGINSSGGVIQQTTPFTLSSDADFISVGRILHQSGSVTNGASTQPLVAYGSNHWHDDFTRAFGPLKVSGHILAASSSAGVGTLGLTKSAGDSYVPGKNYTVDPNNPNNITSATDTAVTVSKIYRAYVSGSTLHLDTGVANAGYTSIDPTKYNNNGTLTSVGSNASIQRVYWYPNSVARAYTVYYGPTTYSDPPGSGQNALDNAQQNIASEEFVEGENTAGAAILVGYILALGTATDLTNPAQARIIQAGVSRGAGAGGGGGVAVGSITPGGLDTYVQFNDGGSTFGGDSGLAYNKTTKDLTITGDLAVNGGDLTSTSTTFNLVNSTATTVNFAGGASTALNIGNSAGTNTISGASKFSQGLSGSLTKLTDGTSYLIAGTNVTITSGSNGAVTISSTGGGGGGGDSFFSSTTVGSIFTTGSAAFRGADSSIDAPSDVGSNVFFFVSGSKATLGTAGINDSVFGGNLVVSGALRVGSNGIEIVSIPGVVTYLDSKTFLNISANGGGVDINESNLIRLLSAAGVRIGSSFFNVNVGDDTSFYVSGTIGGRGSAAGEISTFSGDLVASGTVYALNGLSGSHTRLADGTSAFIAGAGISITTGSNGAVTITNDGTVGDITAVTAGTGLTGGGTTGAVTLSINNSVVATVSGTTFTGATKHNAGLSGSLTLLTDGTSYLIAGAGISISSGSNTGITIFGNANTLALPGSDTQVLFNNNGLIGTDSGITYNQTTDSLTLTGDLAVNGGDITTTASTFNLLNGATTINLGSTASNRLINIGTGTAVQSINIGSENTSSSLILLAGTGNMLLSGSTTATYTIGSSLGTGTITIGNSTAANIISIGSAGNNTANDQTVFIANGTGKSTVTIGSNAAHTGKTTIQAGTSSGGGVVIAQSAGRLGFFGLSTPVTVQSATGDTSVSNTGSTNTVFRNTTFTGGAGATAYTIGDIVKALKAYGLIST